MSVKLSIRFTLSSLLLCTTSMAFSQNLVPNPSFEDTICCPGAPGDIDMAEGWISLCASPDYYNSCSNPSSMGVPHNWAGFQLPASGDSYSGFSSYFGFVTDAREFPSCELASPLSVGSKYYISFKIALSLHESLSTNHATNNLGARFTMNTYTCSSLINNDPQVFVDSIITDSLNWTRVTGSFIADSAYTRIVLGNFFDDVNTDTLKFFYDIQGQDVAYYYLDDICVGTDSAFVYT